MSFIDSLQKDCEYSEDEECSVDSLIDYKNALEDIVNRIDEIARLNAAGKASAADVCQVVFDLGLGN